MAQLPSNNRNSNAFNKGNKKGKSGGRKRKNKNNKSQNVSSNINVVSMSVLNKIPESLRVGIRVTDKYVLFYHGCFSQFYPSRMIIDNVTYQCNEQYMMASKAKLFNDNLHYTLILQNGHNPGQCKRYGRSVQGFNDQTWIENRETIVYKGNYGKFSQNNQLRDVMFTLSVIKDDKNNDNNVKFRTFVECSPRDRIWGIGLNINNIFCDNDSKWRGKNLLGKAITRVRDELWNEMIVNSKNRMNINTNSNIDSTNEMNLKASDASDNDSKSQEKETRTKTKAQTKANSKINANRKK